METSGITIGKEQQVAFTKKEEAYVISKRDWNRLKNNIWKLKHSSSVWSNAFWGALGIGLSCMVSWLANRENLWFLVFGVLGIGVAIVSYLASNSDKTHHEESIEGLKEIVTEIEDAIIPKAEGE